MSKRRYAQAVQTAIDDEMVRLRKQMIGAESPEGTRRLPRGEAPAAPTLGGTRGVPVAPTPAAAAIVVELDARLERLGQVRDWINEDHELATLIDSVIGKQIRASERRLQRFSVVSNIVFLVVGWLLSLFGSPSALLNLFHH